MNSPHHHYRFLLVVILQLVWAFLTAAQCPATGTPPVITAQPLSQSASVQGSVTFSVTGSSSTTMSYQWLKAGTNISKATSSTYTISPLVSSNAGTYSVKVVNSAGTTTSSNATLTVLIPPTITNQPANVTISIGQTAQFSVGASASTSPIANTTNTSATLTYHWMHDGTNISSNTNSTLILTNAQANQAGNYQVIVSQNTSSVTSSVATLTVNYTPVIVSLPQSQTVVAGSNVIFNITATGASPLYYVWCLNGNKMGGSLDDTTGSFTITNVQDASAGVWQVKVYNLFNILSPLSSSNWSLTVLDPPIITNQPHSLVVAKNASATFSVGASGTSPMYYKWFFNNTNLSGKTNVSLTNSSVQQTNYGNYTVLVSNALGTAMSHVAILAPTNPAVSLSASGQGMGKTTNGFSFQFGMPSGFNCVILASKDLLMWKPIATNFCSGNSITFTDASSITNPNCFYKVQIQ